MRLSDVCDVRLGFSARERMEPSTRGIRVIQQGDIGADGSFHGANALRVDPGLGSSEHQVSTGDVLLRSRGISVSAWAVSEALQESALAVAPLYILRPIIDYLDSTYLAWMLMRPAAQNFFARESVGTNLKMIRRSAIETLPVVLPPLETQRAIASAAVLAARELKLALHLAKLHNDLMALRLDGCAPSNHLNDRNAK